jgi:hypothetical protein
MVALFLLVDCVLDHPICGSVYHSCCIRNTKQMD